MSLVDDIELLVKRKVLKITEVSYYDSKVKSGEYSYKYFLVRNAENGAVDAVVLYGVFISTIRNVSDGTKVNLSWKDARRIKNLAKTEHNFSLSDKYKDLIEETNNNILKKAMD